MGKKYSILRNDLDTVNQLCSDEKFLKITGLRLKYSIRGRVHRVRVKRNVIIVEKSIEGEGSTVLGQITTSNISNIITTAQYLISIANICKITNEDNLCCICLERNIEILLICGHGYCEKDILDWENRARNCPMCRKTLVYNQMYASLDYYVDDADVKQAIQEILSLINPI